MLCNEVRLDGIRCVGAYLKPSIECVSVQDITVRYNS